MTIKEKIEMQLTLIVLIIIACFLIAIIAYTLIYPIIIIVVENNIALKICEVISNLLA